MLATEIRNNGFKMAKWTMGALLAGADFIKFGYVSRTNPKDSTQHIILGVQQFQPLELAKQMTLNVNNAWGVLRAIIDTCLKLPPGKYTILKDPNKARFTNLHYELVCSFVACTLKTVCSNCFFCHAVCSKNLHPRRGE